jgi:hypothetical protein
MAQNDSGQRKPVILSEAKNPTRTKQKILRLRLRMTADNASRMTADNASRMTADDPRGAAFARVPSYFICARFPKRRGQKSHETKK